MRQPALPGPTRHRPARTQIAVVETRVARLQAALRDVTAAPTLGDAISIADDALDTI